MFDLPPQPIIVVTASRAPATAIETPASVTVLDAPRIERLGAPLVTDLLRLSPSLNVSVSGPAGSLADVRIRGAEANHTLLFVEGIRANDPAAGNAPRFELLNADLASRIEIVRGPQSALWGSEAIGGVIAVDGPVAGAGGTILDVEAGSFGTRRGAARTSVGSSERGLSIGIAGQRSDGIDSFAGGGERDGYRNLAGRIAGHYRVSEALMLGASGFALSALSEFDGFDPVTFTRADTEDRTRNRIGAARVFATYGDTAKTYATASASLLGSRNRNLVGETEANVTRATRRTLEVEAGHRIGRHAFIAAVEGEREAFRADDEIYGGLTNQDRSRRHQSLTLEHKMTGLGALSTDLAVRHDIFSKFKDATTVRGSALLAIGGGLSLAATYGQGIAQPTFFDLFGFFPGSFAGNPALRPETSRGGEIALRYRKGPLAAALTLIGSACATRSSTSSLSRSRPRSMRRGPAAARGSRSRPTMPPRTRCACRHITLTSTPANRAAPPAPSSRSNVARSIAAASRSTGSRGASPTARPSLSAARTSTPISMSSRPSACGSRLIGSRRPGSPIASPIRWSFTCASPMRSMIAIRTSSATAPREGASMPVSASLLAASAGLRVASLNLCADEYLLLLARPAEIASVSRLAHDPADSLLWRQARRFPANHHGLERVIGTRPTLLLTSGGGGRATSAIAARLGIKTLNLGYPATIADVSATMTRVATALGDRRRADGWQRRLARLQAARLPLRDTIFLSGGGNSVGTGSLERAVDGLGRLSTARPARRPRHA